VTDLEKTHLHHSCAGIHTAQAQASEVSESSETKQGLCKLLYRSIATTASMTAESQPHQGVCLNEAAIVA